MTGARRLDWRFLLSLPPGGIDHLILLGGDAALRGLAVELGMARRVSASLSEGAPADLVAVLSGARADPHRVAAALRRGGAWYWEVDRPLALRWGGSGFAPTADRLARAGLGASTAYWVHGGFTTPRLFMPLDRDAALAWYFSTIFRTHSVGRRTLRAGLRILTGWRGPRFERLVRHYALVGTGGHPPAVLGAVGSNHVGHDPRPLVLLGGEGEWSRVTLVPFPTPQGTPAVVVKLARRSAFAGRTEHEQQVLRELSSRAPWSLGRSIPRPLGFFDWQGLGVGIESRAAGTPLLSDAPGDANSAARQLAGAGAWLTDLHMATERERVGGQALRDRLVGAPLGQYESVFGHDSREARLFAYARRHAERSEGAELPIVLEHGDFGPWNVFRDGRHITVVDWEAARDGPPLCDLLYFLAHWDAQSHHRGMPQAVRRLAIPLSAPRGDRHAEIARREIVWYTRRLGVTETLYPLLVLYTFVEQALDRVARLREQGDPGAADRAANPYVACVGALAGEVERLFPESS